MQSYTFFRNILFHTVFYTKCNDISSKDDVIGEKNKEILFCI